MHHGENKKEYFSQYTFERIDLFLLHVTWAGSMPSSFQIIFFLLFSFSNSIDISDTELPATSPPPTSNIELDPRQQALNYSTLAGAAAVSIPNGQDPSLSSTETLLRNIQGLLKVAADNARQQERQISFEKGKGATLSDNVEWKALR